MTSAGVARLAADYACTTNYAWTRDKAINFLKRAATPEAEMILKRLGE